MAVEIEGRFPQLGQRIRTVVQYTGLSDDALRTAARELFRELFDEQPVAIYDDLLSSRP